MTKPLPIDEATALALMAYLDGELSAADRDALDLRISEEPALQEALASLAEGHALVRDAFAAMPVPGDLASSIVDAVERATIPPPAVLRPVSRLRRLAPVAMALSLPAAAAIFFIMRAHPEAPHALELPQVESAPVNDGEGVDVDEVEASARPVTVFTLPAVAARVHGTSIVVWMDDDDGDSAVGTTGASVEGVSPSP